MAKRGKSSKDEASVTAPAAAGVSAGGGTVDYGLDYPKRVSAEWARAGWLVGLGLVIYYINFQEYPGPALRFGGAVALIGLFFAGVGFYMRWSSSTGKIQLRDRILDSLSISGEEKVLDAGCGRGLMSIAIAKKLEGGKVTAIDTWNPERLSGNSQEAIRDNAQAEQIAPKLRIERGDIVKLGYPDASYDTVLAIGILQDLATEDLRAQAVRELLRVLRPGGKMVIYDRYAASEYSPLLKSSGVTTLEPLSTSFLWAIPAQLLKVTK